MLVIIYQEIPDNKKGDKCCSLCNNSDKNIGVKNV
jgi:hypothetical protein